MKGAGESRLEFSGALIGLILDSLIFWDCFSKFNEKAQNNEKQELQNAQKTTIFLHNFCETAFAHQCKIISKFCAFTQNIRKSLHN